MSWTFTPSPYMRELMAVADVSRREIVIKKSSAVGWTEIACITAMQIAKRMKKQKRHRPAPSFKRSALAAAIENNAEGEAQWNL